MATSTGKLEQAEIEAQVLEAVGELLRAKGAGELVESLRPDSSFAELGIRRSDLLDLLVRFESRFEVELHPVMAERSETPAAWVKAILEGPELVPGRKYRITPPRADALPEPVSAKTLIDVLVRHAEADPGRIQIHLLEGDSGEGITYGKLYEEASAIAGGLADLGLQHGDAVAIMLPSCSGFFFSFFGTMLAGGIPVPVYPPTRPERIEDYVRQQIALLRNAGIRYMIAFERVKPVTQILRVNLPSLIEVTTVKALRKSRARLGAGSVRTARTAVLQYTSGSTGNPKGVALSHANILANVRGIGTAVEINPGDAVVSWLPLYSDLGLIGCWMLSLYYAIPVTILSPLDFLKAPERWFWAIHDSRGTLSAAPNFAYDLCTRRIPLPSLEGVDLSCWRVAVNAGEPVLPETVDRFTERFRDFGFRPETFLPCYGLAESTVALTMPPPGRLPVRDRVKRAPFETRGFVEPASPNETHSLCFFSTGEPIQGQEIRVEDDSGDETPERAVGRLLFRGPATMQGYYRDREATEASIRPGGWVDSGDYGYMAGGEFYFSGRSRDSIRKAGRTMSPLDVEAAIGDVRGVMPGSAVAFGAPDRDSGVERLIVAAETDETSQEEFRRIEAEIVRLVDHYLGMPPDRVQLVEPDCLPRTANGKIRRNDTRSRHLKNKLRSRKRPPWLQIVKLRVENVGSLGALGLRRAGGALIRAWRAAVTWLIARGAGAWFRLNGNRTVVKRASKWILKLHGQRFAAQGAQLLEVGRPSLLVANRSGLLDPLVAVAALPVDVRFAEVSALYGLPEPLAFLLRPLVLGHDDDDLTPVAGALRQRVRRALEGDGAVVLFPDSPIGAPVPRARFRLDPLLASLDAGANVHPISLRERALSRLAAERAQARKVTMMIVRESVRNGDGVSAWQMRDRVRDAIGEYRA
ncbi:MAG: AMP-binding protein [Bryobacteraceae bacterium]|nr:AMP-binding protein [Bryobacteraceae bacterium]